MAELIRLTKEGLAKLKKELVELKTVRREELAAAPEAGVASIGSTVTTTVNNQTRVFSIVGATEADPAHGRISAESPIGKALMRGKAGDDVLVQTPAGPARYRIEKVE